MKVKLTKSDELIFKELSNAVERAELALADAREARRFFILSKSPVVPGQRVWSTHGSRHAFGSKPIYNEFEIMSLHPHTWEDDQFSVKAWRILRDGTRGAYVHLDEFLTEQPK